MLKRKAEYFELLMLNGTFFYQYEPYTDEILFDGKDNIFVEVSKKTKKIRHVTLNGKILATIRPKDGFLIFTIEGAEFVKKKIRELPKKVYVSNEGVKSLKTTSSIFTKQIVKLDENIRPNDEVFILDLKGDIVATGKSNLSSEEMRSLKRGVAIKVRHKRKIQ